MVVMARIRVAISGQQWG